MTNLFNLPILEVDGGAATEEIDHGDELVPIPSADHRTDDPRQRASRDPDLRTHGYHGFGRDRQPRAEHRVDLAEVADESFLVDDRQYVHQPIPAERRQSVVRIAVEEEVTCKQRHNRFELSALGRPAFFDDLG